MDYWQHQINIASSIPKRRTGFTLRPKFEILGPNDSEYSHWNRQAPDQVIGSDETNQVIRSWWH